MKLLWSIKCATFSKVIISAMVPFKTSFLQTLALVIQVREVPVWANSTSTKDWDWRGIKRRGVGDSQEKLPNLLQKKNAVENGTSVYNLILLHVPFG